MNDTRARELVAAERTRVEAALHASIGDIGAESRLGRQQAGETESGSELATEMIDVAMVADLQATLAAVGRAEARIVAGTYGVSVDSGIAIPDGRLEAAPLAERTVEEQQRYEAAGVQRGPLDSA